MYGLDLLPFVTYGELFPEGITRYAIGGLLIGLGVAVIYLGTGIIAGASTFLESTLSYVSGRSRFQQARFVASRDWRVVFTAGMVLGAAGYWFLVLNPVWDEGLAAAAWQTDVQPWRLLLGGFLVGVGTRLGKGCTSGHGVCGVGSFSGTSIANVATFLLVAIGTAQLVMAAGVTP
ncbi:YeeE/YedE family protein [Halovivax sp.]|uniref:YeeE/YedE family protein n=1 Tax=Halovivax sp. TaxID=1935978 RepID=UPI0025BE22D9|nr:YeeE/YedE family protein [Halovivax sp.]